MTERGERLVEANSPAAYDELVVEAISLWRPRNIRVRITTRPIDQADVDQLDERIAAAGDSDGVLIAAYGHSENLQIPARVTLVEPEEFIARLERCASIAWFGGAPAPAYDRMAVFRDLERTAALLDSVGLHWLPILALNELPIELTATGIAPQDLLERFSFRLLTATFRFAGEGYGEAARGERLADSLVRFPPCAPQFAALVDCKAASDGYSMDADHVLRFQRYVADARQNMDGEEYELRHLVVLSSSFAEASSRAEGGGLLRKRGAPSSLRAPSG